MKNKKRGDDREFLSLKRREFIQLGLFGTVVTAGTMYKRFVLDVIPNFVVDTISNLEDCLVIPNKSNFVWDDKYSLNFAYKYIDFAKYLQSHTNTDFLKDLTLHPFPIDKYKLTKDNLINKGILSIDDFTDTKPVSLTDLFRVHSKGHILKLYLMGKTYLGLNNGENPLMPEIPDYVRTVSGGTYTAARIALEKGISMNLNGGFHHAMADSESGFCYINDVAIAIKKLRSENALKKVMVIDMDIHHGDGNAKVMEADKNVVIYDVYQENNFPQQKYHVKYKVSINTNEVSNVDDNYYLGAIKGIPGTIECERPDLIIYLAGSDPHVNDMLGGFRLSKKGLKDRDEYIIEAARKRDIPITVLMAGGYPRNIDDVVEIHSNTAELVKIYS